MTATIITPTAIITTATGIRTTMPTRTRRRARQRRRRGLSAQAPMPDYLRDPGAIYARSFALIRAEVPLDRFPAGLHGLVLRLVHACGMPDIADDLAWNGDPAAAGRAALAAGAPILVDARMVAAGIMTARLPARNRVVADARRRAHAPALATGLGTTRSAAAVELWRPRLGRRRGRDRQRAHRPVPSARAAARMAGAAGGDPGLPGRLRGCRREQGGADRGRSRTVPWLTLRGRRGGSAMAAAAVNALLVGSALTRSPG